jgi:hypothetical protein
MRNSHPESSLINSYWYERVRDFSYRRNDKICKISYHTLYIGNHHVTL